MSNKKDKPVNPYGPGTKIIEDVIKKKAQEARAASRSALNRHRIRSIVYMAALGLSNKEIAEQIGANRTWVNKIIASDSGQKEIERVQQRLFFQEPQKMFQAIVPKAVQVAYKEMTAKSTKSQTKVDAAFKFIERAYGKPKQEIEHKGHTIKDLYLALDSKKEQPQDIQDAEFTNVEEKLRDIPGRDDSESDETQEDGSEQTELEESDS